MLSLLIVHAMRLNWHLLSLAVLVMLAVLGAGCSGINASGSGSPASFFLPGLMQNAPLPPGLPDPGAPVGSV
jgi:hypothetical protein